MSHNVLIVDDDPIIRDMMIDILAFEDCTITVARNGQEALTYLRKEGAAVPRSIIFLDLMMPVMNGQEFCEALEAEPGLRQRQVIILMSAMDGLSELTTLRADAVMPKPFSVDDVMGVLEPFVGQG